MEKKEKYEKPRMEVVEMRVASPLLEGSTDVVQGGGTPDY